jgi:hypothetical protein
MSIHAFFATLIGIVILIFLVAICFYQGTKFYDFDDRGEPEFKARVLESYKLSGVSYQYFHMHGTECIAVFYKNDIVLDCNWND